MEVTPMVPVMPSVMMVSKRRFDGDDSDHKCECDRNRDFTNPFALFFP